RPADSAISRKRAGELSSFRSATGAAASTSDPPPAAGFESPPHPVMNADAKSTSARQQTAPPLSSDRTCRQYVWLQPPVIRTTRPARNYPPPVLNFAPRVNYSRSVNLYVRRGADSCEVKPETSRNLTRTTVRREIFLEE